MITRLRLNYAGSREKWIGKQASLSLYSIQLSQIDMHDSVLKYLPLLSGTQGVRHAGMEITETYAWGSGSHRSEIDLVDFDRGHLPKQPSVDIFIRETNAHYRNGHIREFKGPIQLVVVERPEKGPSLGAISILRSGAEWATPKASIPSIQCLWISFAAFPLSLVLESRTAYAASDQARNNLTESFKRRMAPT